MLQSSDHCVEGRMKELSTKTEVSVKVETLWEALVNNLRITLPKVIPNILKDMQVIEGDGGIGTVFLFTFFSDATSVRSQKEKITELDDKSHRFGLQVTEGGYLDQGFSCYKTSFELSAMGELRTQVNIKVSYESGILEEDSSMPMKTAEHTVFFIKCLEKYLLNNCA